MALKLGYKQLTAEAMALLDNPNTFIMDIRDVRELEREEMIFNAFHALRGMLKFWVDLDSSYHNSDWVKNQLELFYFPPF